MVLSIERRVELGKQAIELIEYIEPAFLTNEEVLYIYERIIAEAQKKLPQTLEEYEELTLKQIHIFEEIEMPFGVFKGTKIKDVSQDYLCNLFDPSPFMKKLKLYLEYCSKYRYRD